MVTIKGRLECHGVVLDVIADVAFETAAKKTAPRRRSMCPTATTKQARARPALRCPCLRSTFRYRQAWLSAFGSSESIQHIFAFQFCYVVVPKETQSGKAAGKIVP